MCDGDRSNVQVALKRSSGLLVAMALAMVWAVASRWSFHLAARMASLMIGEVLGCSVQAWQHR